MRNGEIFWATAMVMHDATEQERIRKALEDANADSKEQHVRERIESLAAMSGAARQRDRGAQSRRGHAA